MQRIVKSGVQVIHLPEADLKKLNARTIPQREVVQYFGTGMGRMYGIIHWHKPFERNAQGERSEQWIVKRF